MQPVSILMNIFWILIGGAWMAFGWLVAAIVMAITIVGLPWARAAFNIAVYTLLPFGSKAVRRDEVTGQSARARPRRHRDHPGRDDHRHPIRMGASEACRHRALADRQGDPACLSSAYFRTMSPAGRD